MEFRFEMTLCMVWRAPDNLHFASDSRLSFPGINADIAIKIGRERYRISGAGMVAVEAPPLAEGDVAFCYAGSGVGAMFMKESLSGMLNDLQAVRGWHDTSATAVANLIFEVYKIISRRLTAALCEKGLVDLVVATRCAVQGRFRAFRCQPEIGQTDDQGLQLYSLTEILVGESPYFIFGSGAGAARAKIKAAGEPNESGDMLRILKEVIDDPAVGDVGGNIQFGQFIGGTFATSGILEVAREGPNELARVHYWRGALDLGDASIENKFVIGYPLLDLSSFFPASSEQRSFPAQGQRQLSRSRGPNLNDRL